MLKTLLFALGLSLAGTAAAQYKWVDKNGKVQYSDTPPTGASASTLRRPSAPAADDDEPKKNEASKGSQTHAEKEADFKKRRLEGEKEREKQAQTEREVRDKAENCARAKEAVRTLEGGRVTRVDAKGERYFLNEGQIAQELSRARELAQQWCG